MPCAAFLCAAGFLLLESFRCPSAFHSPEQKPTQPWVVNCAGTSLECSYGFHGAHCETGHLCPPVVGINWCWQQSNKAPWFSPTNCAPVFMLLYSSVVETFHKTWKPIIHVKSRTSRMLKAWWQIANWFSRKYSLFTVAFTSNLIKRWHFSFSWSAESFTLQHMTCRIFWSLCTACSHIVLNFLLHLFWLQTTCMAWDYAVLFCAQRTVQGRC